MRIPVRVRLRRIRLIDPYPHAFGLVSDVAVQESGRCDQGQDIVLILGLDAKRSCSKLTARARALVLRPRPVEDFVALEPEVELLPSTWTLKPCVCNGKKFVDLPVIGPTWLDVHPIYFEGIGDNRQDAPVQESRR